MTITTIASVFAIALTGLIPASCNKTTATAKGTPMTANAGTNNVNNSGDLSRCNALNNSASLNSTNCYLGEITLTNHSETCVKIGRNKQCIFTTKMLDRKNAQITLALECKSTNSKPANLSVTQIVTKSDKPFDIALGDYSLSFTPHIVSE